MDSATEFLSVLFGKIPEDMRFAITTIDKRAKIVAVRSNWYSGQEVEEAAGFSIEMAQTVDVYVCVAVFDEKFVDSIITRGRSQNRQSKQRGTTEQAAGIVSFVADVDFGGEGHKHVDLPADADEARKLIESMPLPTTFINHSGNGLHAWWAFEEPVIFHTDGDRNQIVDLSRRWQQQLMRDGKHVDSTYDITRILRVPGTFNRKSDPDVKLVETVSHRPDSVYVVADFEKNSAATSDEPPNSRTKAPRKEGNGDSKLNLQGEEFSDVKLNRIIRSEGNSGDTFLTTFYRTRKMTGGDTNSEYDMSLANYGVKYDLTDQEIVDLIVLSRQRSGRPVDRMNVNYYITTIGKARAAHAGAEEIREIGDQKDEGDEVGARLRAINLIRTELNLPIVRILRYVSDEPSYSIVFEEKGGELHEVPLKNLDILANQARFLTFCIGQGHVFSKVKKWEDSILKPMMLAVEDIDDRATNTLKEEWTDKIERYVASKAVHEELTDITWLFRDPFMKDGSLHMFGVDFNNWLKSEPGGFSSKVAGKFLRSEIGAETKGLSYRLESGKVVNSNVWILPDSFSHIARMHPNASRQNRVKGDKNGSK